MAGSVTISSGIPQQQAEGTTWKTLLYGVSGAGKTRTASLWPKPLFIDFDHGLSSIDRKIAWVTIEKWGDWVAWFEIMMSKKLQCETIIIDSIPAMQRMAMEASVRGYTAKRAHGDIPGQSDYGKMFWDVWRTLDEVLTLPYHKVFITQAELGDYGEPHHPTFVGQAIASPLLQAMDLIGYVEKTGPKELGLSFDRPDAITKDRPGLFTGSILLNPTWNDIGGAKRTNTKPPKVETGIPA